MKEFCQIKSDNEPLTVDTSTWVINGSVADE